MNKPLVKLRKLKAKQVEKLLRKRLPIVKRRLKALEEAQKVPRSLLDLQIDF